jgi:clan AA aspartic protease
MMSGFVEHGEARLRLKVIGPLDEQEIDCVVDTGYSDDLTLPPTLVTKLGLNWDGFGRSVLADGSICLFDIYTAYVIWDGERRDVLIDEADTEPLIGMNLMAGYELKIQVWPAGKVRLKQLKLMS